MRAMLLCIGLGLIFGCTMVFSLDDYALQFPTSGVSDYVHIWGMPSLTQFTVCLWMRSGSNKGTLFSYAVPNVNNALLIEYVNNAFVLTINGKTKSSTVSANDDNWHHICASWKNNAGSYGLYKDGVVAAQGTGLNTDGVIAAEGSLVLSQKQGSLGGGFDASQSFVGTLANVNIWDYVLPPSKIHKMSTSCRCEIEPGNVYKSSDFIFGREGKPRVVIPSPCEPQGSN